MAGKVVAAVMVVVTSASAFNVNLKDPVILSPQDQSQVHFGFSLAPFRNGTEQRLLVGAPLANTTQNVTRPGALYSCDLASSSCAQVTVDTRYQPEDKYRTWIDSDLKDDQGLGFSLAARDDSGIVVCAPRWHIQLKIPKGIVDLPVGICFASQPNNNTFHAFSPAYDVSPDAGKMNYANNGSCMVGISADMDKTGKGATLGSPGCWIFEGDVWKVDISKVNQPSTFSRAGVLKSNELNPSILGSNVPSDVLLGYSTAAITYDGSPCVLASMPKATSQTSDKGIGPLVAILQKQSNMLKVKDVLKQPNINPKDSPMYSYFGYSLCVVDVNGDGLDDVVVGAPLYNADKGAVFLYMQKVMARGDTQRVQMQDDGLVDVEGELERFGTSIAAVGDLDQDGYQDVAVGAPYGLGGGKVYIYRGSETGLRKTASQIISASNFGVSLDAFGYSIAHAMPDTHIAVAAFESDRVVVLSTKEVIQFNMDFKIVEPSIILNDNCSFTTPDGAVEKHPCVQSQVCVNYIVRNPNGANTNQLTFTIELNLDHKEEPRRLFFSNGQGQHDKNVTITADEGRYSCHAEKVFAKSNLLNWKTFNNHARLVGYNIPQNRAMLDPDALTYADNTLEVDIQCEDQTCISDLTLQYEILQNFTLANSSVIVAFRIRNNGDDAFNTELKLASDELERQYNSENVQCENADRKHTVECSIIKHIEKHTEVNFTLTMQPRQSFYTATTQETHANYFNVMARLTTRFDLANPDATRAEIKIPIEVDMALDLTKIGSNPAKVEYDPSSRFKEPSAAKGEDELGPEVKHDYNIYNKHKNRYIFETSVVIRWPLKLEGKYLMYLLEPPHFDVKHWCTYTGGDVDEFGLSGKFANGGSVQGGIEQSGNYSKGVDGAAAIRSRSSRGANIEYLVFECRLGRISGEQNTVVSLRSRVVQATLREQSFGEELKNVSSYVSVQILKLPWGAPQPASSPESIIETGISYAKHGTPGKVAWWVYLLSVLAGLFILALIVIILWKCGFFKRKQRTVEDGSAEAGGEVPEEQETNLDSPVTPEEHVRNDTENANDDFTFSQK